MHRLLPWLFLCSLLAYSACQYPYNTPQARRARQAARTAAKTLRQQPPQVVLDSSSLTAADSSQIAQPDSSALKPGKGNKLVTTTSNDSTPPPTKGGKIKTMNPTDSNAIAANDSLKINPLDSNRLDSLGLVLRDTLPRPDSVLLPYKTIAFSKDSLYAPVQYGARDSMIYDIINRKVYLYGNAEVFYEQYSLKAGYIIFDFATNVATAEGLTDSTGAVVGRPYFSDGQQNFEARKIEYNFKSKKGKVYDAATTQGDGFFIANETKFIAKDSPTSLERGDDVIYSSQAIYTTCNHYQPHFGIRVARAKVIPNKVIVAGPAYLEIMGVPTPLALPFAFFPINSPEKRKSGLLLTSDVEFSPTLGPGLKGVGYYWSIGQFFDLSLTADVYMRGSFRVKAASRYVQKYKTSGSLEVGYSYLRTDKKWSPAYSLRQDFNFRWTHQQDQKAHPSQTFQASVNFGTSSYFKNTTNDANAVLANSFNSTISYTKRFPGTPVSLSLSMAHSQNTQTRAMTLTLPKVDLRVNRITPFARKKRVGAERWYERIGFSYNFAAQNTLNTIDTVFFQAFRYGNLREDIFDKMEYSVRHSPALDFSFKLFKHINVQPTINYSETWYFYRNEKMFNPDLVIKYDTLYDPDNDTLITQINADTTFGTVEVVPRSETYGFYPVRDLSAGVTLNTQLFAIGSFRFGKNMPKGESHKIRLTLRPSIGFQWRPDYSKEFWGYYDSVQVDARYPYELQGYKRFPSVPSAGKSALINYSLTAVLDGKFWRKSPVNTADSIAAANATDKNKNYQKSILINNLSLSGNYNIIADSLHWSPIAIRANTKLFKLFDVTFATTLDLYAANPETNARIQRFQWQVTKELARMTSLNLNVSTGFTMNDLRKIFTPKKAAENNNTANKKTPDLIQNFRIAYNLAVSRKFIEGVDSTLITANELSLSGTINLSKGWNIIIGRVGYDFNKKRITYPDFTFARDLHCWQMGVSWQPERRTWSFFLRVRPGSLGFINVPVRKNFYDPF